MDGCQDEATDQPFHDMRTCAARAESVQTAHHRETARIPAPRPANHATCARIGR
jgi:hypothetical protein